MDDHAKEQARINRSVPISRDDVIARLRTYVESEVEEALFRRDARRYNVIDLLPIYLQLDMLAKLQALSEHLDALRASMPSGLARLAEEVKQQIARGETEEGGFGGEE